MPKTTKLEAGEVSISILCSKYNERVIVGVREFEYSKKDLTCGILEDISILEYYEPKFKCAGCTVSECRMFSLDDILINEVWYYIRRQREEEKEQKVMDDYDEWKRRHR